MALIEHREFDALKVIKNSRATAEKLLMIEPNYYDAYLAIGVENYLFSLKSAPHALDLAGRRRRRRTTSAAWKILRLTAEKGRYLNPYARLLLAVAALRDKDRSQARDLLVRSGARISAQPLYAQELAQLQ